MVLALTMVGMIDASATPSRSTTRTRNTLWTYTQTLLAAPVRLERDLRICGGLLIYRLFSHPGPTRRQDVHKLCLLM
jgi:hypothetical protein